MANNALEVDIFGTTEPHQTSSRRRRWLFGNVSGTASAATVLLLCLGGYYASTLEGVKSGRSTLPDNSKILLKQEGESSHTARALTEAVLGSAVLEPEKEKVEKTSRMYSDISKIPPNYDHKQPTEEEKEALAEKYGKWHFWDGDETSRPTGDYCAEFENRDIPGDHFPDDAWQVDAVYVNHIINDASKLVSRAQEAIFTEVGHPKPLPPEGLAERFRMFKWDIVDLKTTTSVDRSAKSRGGWTTESSFDGLVRRLLHAIMTNDEFTVVVGGHSAAAGHGNHFHQNYAHRFHAIMAPVFARLGVKLVTRNMANGGVGTVQHSLGSKDIYGSDIDILIWDSGMTEISKAAQSLFVRQALMSPGKVPVVWGPDISVLAEIHRATNADVGEMGMADSGVPVIHSKEQAETVPYALRYMKCAHDMVDLCKGEPKYCAKCWIARDDIDTSDWPPMQEHPGSQVSWHPGWRWHQLKGNVLAFTVLDALQDAMQRFSEGTMSGPPLDDAEWHVTEHYNEIREKVKQMEPGACAEYLGSASRACTLSLHGATQHTPRNRPNETALTALMKPTASGYKPVNPRKMLYDSLDVPNPCYDVPADEPDVLAIVSGRRRLKEHKPSEDVENFPQELTVGEASSRHVRSLAEKIVPGSGWQVASEKPGGTCDGGYNSICGRDDGCPLYGHHDSRGILSGSGLSGWLVFDIPRVEDGFILLKVYTWGGEHTLTKDWTTVNEKESRDLLQVGHSNQTVWFSDTNREGERRHLRGDPFASLPESFVFEYAINGDITSLTKADLKTRVFEPARMVQLITLLDDTSFPATDNVEVAVRMTGCGNDCIFSVTHLYWA